MATANQTKVITGKVRLSYANLWTPRQNDNGVDTYGCKLLIPKSDKATIKALRAAQKAAIEQGNNGKFNGKKLRGEPGTGAAWDTIHDGDDSEADEDHDHWTMNVSSRNQPGIVDRAVQPILDSSEVYSGCYARVSLNAFPYNYQGKIGVTFGLNHVQKLADGDFLGGRTRAEDDFDELDEDYDDVM